MAKKILKISKYKPSILQGTFEFSAGSSHVSLSLEHPRERFIMSVLGITLAVLVCAYLYFITASVLNVIARKEALAQTTDLQGQIGMLEQHYLELSNAANPEEGAALGLVPVKNTEYIYRPGTIGAADIARNAN
jgi:hypothetical protein